MRKAYRFMLLLYPRGHREQFAEEMNQVFEQLAAERRERGWTWYVRFAFGETAGLIGGAARAWLERRSTRPEPGQTPTRWMPQELAEAQQRVDASVADMVQAIANHRFERARVLSNQEREAREKLRELREKYGDEYGRCV
jgi:hypothetical protein